MTGKTNKILGLILMLIIWANCSNRKAEIKDSNGYSVINSSFPFELDKIDLSSSENLLQVNDEISSRIEKTIEDYYKEECLNDSLSSYKDTYVTTIRLSDSLQTIYFVLLKNYPTEELNSKILFYDNLRKNFLEHKLDFKIYALYEFEDNKLKESNLKSTFKIETPEIELLDFNNDGIRDFKFTRLFHNGTFNSIHTTVLTVEDLTLDTLDFKEQAVGQ